MATLTICDYKGGQNEVGDQHAATIRVLARTRKASKGMAVEVETLPIVECCIHHLSWAVQEGWKKGRPLTNFDELVVREISQ